MGEEFLELARGVAVAEGVEEPAQAQWLKDYNCSCAQGFLFSRPVSPEELENLALKMNNDLERMGDRGDGTYRGDILGIHLDQTARRKRVRSRRLQRAWLDGQIGK